MAPYQQDTISRQDGINPWGLIIAVILFIFASASLSWVGISHFTRRAAAALNAVPSVSGQQPVPAASGTPGAASDSALIETDAIGRNATAALPEASGKVIAEKRTAAKVNPVRKEKNPGYVAAPERRKTATASPSAPPPVPGVRADKTEVSIASSPASRPSTLVTRKDVAAKTGTGASAGVEKVKEKSLAGGPVDWYALHVGFTDSKVRADILRDVLAGQGFTEARTVSEGKNSFYIDVGRYQFRYEAELAAKTVSEKTGLTPRVYEKTVAE